MKHLTNLYADMNEIRPLLEWYTDNWDTAEGKAMEKRANAAFSKLSIEHGGGVKPFLLTAQKDTAKTDKNTSVVYEQIIRYLMAANRSGVINLCPSSTPLCRAACLGHTSGRLQFKGQQLAQYVRTLFLASDVLNFHIVELSETRKAAKRVERLGRRLVARYNGTSDIVYEDNLDWYMACLSKAGVAVMFDYTAVPGRGDGWKQTSVMPYHVTQSTKETSAPNDVKPGSYTVVDTKPKHPLPATYNGYPVHDGDLSDMRFLDPAGHVTLGRGKGALRGKVGAPDDFLKPSICRARIPVSASN